MSALAQIIDSEVEGTKWHWGLMVFLPFAAALSDMTQDEAYDLLKDCVKEIHKRLIINLPNFHVQIIDKDGIRRLDDITIKNLKWWFSSIDYCIE